MTIQPQPEYEQQLAETRHERMAWWRQARFGMFVTWGLYALLGRHEWVRAFEAIPQDEYDQLADQFQPNERPAREWARLARDAGMKYMVMTAKHHEGFCLWDTAQTDFNSVKRGPKRDLVREFVEACREFDLGVGLYYSLMDWHHPDGGRCAYDPEARQRFVDFTRGCVRELMSSYGHVDILWYDMPRPMQSAEGWQSLSINQMARELQPHLLINNRSRLDEDFSTPENQIRAAEEGRGWESCMTFQGRAWGWMPSADVDSWRPRDIVNLLNKACSGGGNLLLNIGPGPDGSPPPAAVEALSQAGQWLSARQEAVYGELDRCICRRSSACGNYSRKGNRVYFWVHCWPGKEMSLGGFATRLKRAWLLTTGEPVEFEQERYRIRLKNLPEQCPDQTLGMEIIVLDFETPPVHHAIPQIEAMNGGRQIPGFEG